MTSLFVDTSGWASVFIPTETHHAQATAYIHSAQKSRQILITTNYIISELVALLGSRYRVPRTKIFQYIDGIKNTPLTQVAHIATETDSEAWKLCKSRPDKAWSLVDSSSFIVMNRLSISAALTTDKHFEQAGFVRLLK
ncbi:MAG: VapC toxin family PIN domain ribonuclease [Cyanobacteria bacterium J06634_6]